MGRGNYQHGKNTLPEGRAGRAPLLPCLLYADHHSTIVHFHTGIPCMRSRVLRSFNTNALTVDRATSHRRWLPNAKHFAILYGFFESLLSAEIGCAVCHD